MSGSSIFAALASIFDRVSTGAVSGAQGVTELVAHVKEIATDLAAVKADIVALRTGGATLAEVTQLGSDVGELAHDGVDVAAAVVPSIQPEVAAIDDVIAIVGQLGHALAALKAQNAA